MTNLPKAAYRLSLTTFTATFAVWLPQNADWALILIKRRSADWGGLAIAISVTSRLFDDCPDETDQTQQSPF
jgi:hypothetical protein